jgi:hypothetical protein
MNLNSADLKIINKHIQTGQIQAAWNFTKICASTQQHEHTRYAFEGRALTVEISSCLERGIMSPLSTNVKFPESERKLGAGMALSLSTNSTSAVILTCCITSSHCKDTQGRTITKMREGYLRFLRVRNHDFCVKDADGKRRLHLTDSSSASSTAAKK